MYKWLYPPREMILRRTATRAPLTPDALAQTYLNAVLNYVSGRIGAGAEAEDVTAEVFAAAFDRWTHLPQPAHAETAEQHDPVRAYLFGIARRKIADLHRQRKRHPQTHLTDTLSLPSSAPEPETQAMASEAANILHGILQTLPENQREALRLRYLENLPLSEIARIMYRSSASVTGLLQRGRAAVRQRGSSYFCEEETK